MRQFTEPTAKNLLRRPLIFGVPLPGLLILAFATLGVLITAGSSSIADSAALAVASAGYLVLRVLAKFARTGWEESLIFPIEKLMWKRSGQPKLRLSDSSLESCSPETLETTDLIFEKENLAERIRALAADEDLCFVVSFESSGTRILRLERSGEMCSGGDWKHVAPCRLIQQNVWSLSALPVATDPLWSFSQFSRLRGSCQVLIRIRGLDFQQIKRRIELSRRRNARDGSRISDIDAEVTFEEASRVLQGLSRGDESLVEFSMVILSENEQPGLDPQYFTREKDKNLSLLSISGLRRRFHRSHVVRAVTAADLIPSVGDPEEAGTPILKTLRGNPLYFSPQDPRLEALHWLVIGASGSGKSFFTGLVLKRMLEGGMPMSVLYVDHNRSFRRITRSQGGNYYEPKSIQDTDRACADLFEVLNRPGVVAGIELSDLDISEKKAAAQTLLSRIETFLRFRDSTHPVYLVLDECWNFLRDEPALVQRAFREFRKLNGAVIAITQSLSDFITDQTGQSILQNAPIRILLRQGEDLSAYRGALGLNSVELGRLRLLKQRRGEFSECLIKTPFLSRLGRLYPTDEEYELLRTDNLRDEVIREARAKREASCAPS